MPEQRLRLATPSLSVSPQFWMTRRQCTGLSTHLGAVDKLMIDQGYIKSGFDTCLSYKDVRQSCIIIALYLDDGLIVLDRQNLVEQEPAALNRVYRVHRLGAQSFLSLEAVGSSTRILTYQHKYIKSILARYGIDT